MENVIVKQEEEDWTYNFDGTGTELEVKIEFDQDVDLQSAWESTVPSLFNNSLTIKQEPIDSFKEAITSQEKSTLCMTPHYVCDATIIKVKDPFTEAVVNENDVCLQEESLQNDVKEEYDKDEETAAATNIADRKRCIPVTVGRKFVLVPRSTRNTLAAAPNTHKEQVGLQPPVAKNITTSIPKPVLRISNTKPVSKLFSTAKPCLQPKRIQSPQKTENYIVKGYRSIADCVFQPKTKNKTMDAIKTNLRPAMNNVIQHSVTNRILDHAVAKNYMTPLILTKKITPLVTNKCINIPVVHNTSPLVRSSIQSPQKTESYIVKGYRSIPDCIFQPKIKHKTMDVIKTNLRPAMNNDIQHSVTNRILDHAVAKKYVTPSILTNKITPLVTNNCLNVPVVKNTSPLVKSSFNTSPLVRSSYNTLRLVRSSYNTSPLVRSSYNTSPLVRSSCNTSPLVRSSYNTLPLVRSSYNTLPLVRSSCNTSPLVRSTCDTSPLVRISCNTSPLVRISCNISPLVKSSYNISPLVRSTCDTSPLVRISCNTSPLVRSSYNISPLVKSSYNTSPLVRSSYNTSPLVSKDSTQAKAFQRPCFVKLDRLKILTCAVCRQQFYLKSKFVQHVFQHVRIMPNVPCNICGKYYQRKYIKIHERKEHGPKKFWCDHCGKKCSDKDSLIKHLIVHSDYSDMKLYSCDVCNKRFRRNSNLLSHQKMHSSDKQFPQKVRPETIQLPGVLQPTTTEKYIEVPRKKKCNVQGATRVPGLKKHICEICNKHFEHKTQLRKHECTDWEEQFRCPVCNKQFKHKSSLDSHKWVHISRRLFTCRFCHKRFKRKGTMTTHERTHTGYKPYSCEMCNKEFTQLTSLNNHTLLHEGIKPHPCPNCPKKFTQISNLRRHLNKGECP